MHAFIDKTIRILQDKFHCSRLTTVQDIQDYASLIFLGHGVFGIWSTMVHCGYVTRKVSQVSVNLYSVSSRTRL